MNRNPVELRIKADNLEAESIIIKNYELKHLQEAELQKNLIDYQWGRNLLGKKVLVKRDDPISPEFRAKLEERRRKALAGFANISQHRLNVVRKEARATHLARMFLRGTPYKAVERICYEEPKWDTVQYMILRYGGMDKREARTKFAEWSAVSSVIVGPGKRRKDEPMLNHDALADIRQYNVHNLHMVEDTPERIQALAKKYDRSVQHIKDALFHKGIYKVVAIVDDLEVPNPTKAA